MKTSRTKSRSPRQTTGTARGLTVGQVARKYGVTIQTLRFYEREGIIREPDRSSGGYRMYADAELTIIRFILGAKACGFTLREIRELVDLKTSSDARCAEVRERTEDKLLEVEKKLANLKTLRKQLKQLIRDCPPGDRGVDGCNIIRDLEQKNSPS